MQEERIAWEEYNCFASPSTQWLSELRNELAEKGITNSEFCIESLPTNIQKTDFAGIAERMIDNHTFRVFVNLPQKQKKRFLEKLEKALQERNPDKKIEFHNL